MDYNEDIRNIYGRKNLQIYVRKTMRRIKKKIASKIMRIIFKNIRREENNDKYYKKY